MDPNSLKSLLSSSTSSSNSNSPSSLTSSSSITSKSSSSSDQTNNNTNELKSKPPIIIPKRKKSTSINPSNPNSNSNSNSSNLLGGTKFKTRGGGSNHPNLNSTSTGMGEAARLMGVGLITSTTTRIEEETSGNSKNSMLPPPLTSTSDIVRKVGGAGNGVITRSTSSGNTRSKNEIEAIVEEFVVPPSPITTTSTSTPFNVTSNNNNARFGSPNHLNRFTSPSITTNNDFISSNLNESISPPLNGTLTPLRLYEAKELARRITAGVSDNDRNIQEKEKLGENFLPLTTSRIENDLEMNLGTNIDRSKSRRDDRINFSDNHHNSIEGLDEEGEGEDEIIIVRTGSRDRRSRSRVEEEEEGIEFKSEEEEEGDIRMNDRSIDRNDNRRNLKRSAMIEEEDFSRDGERGSKYRELYDEDDRPYRIGQNHQYEIHRQASPNFNRHQRDSRRLSSLEPNRTTYINNNQYTTTQHHSHPHSQSDEIEIPTTISSISTSNNNGSSTIKFNPLSSLSTLFPKIENPHFHLGNLRLDQEIDLEHEDDDDIDENENESNTIKDENKLKESKFENCTMEEWEKEGEELTKRFGELMKKVVEIVVRKSTRTKEYEKRIQEHKFALKEREEALIGTGSNLTTWAGELVGLK